MRINTKICLFVIILLLLPGAVSLHSQVVINEVSAMNYGMPFDDNFDSPDWIELYNTSDDPVNISGYRISDKNDFESAWEIPSKLLSGKDYLLLFADGKDESDKRRLTLEASGHGVSVLWDYDGFRYEYIEHEGDFELQMRVHSFIDAHIYGSVGLALRNELTDRSKMVGVFCRSKEIRQYFSYIREETNTILKEQKTIIKPEYPYCRIQLKKVGDTVYTNVIDKTGYPLESKAYYYPIAGKFYIGIAVSSADRSKNCRAVVSEIKLNGKDMAGNDFQSIEWHLPIESKKYYSKELHTNFKLNIKGETIYLFDPVGNIVDEIQFPALKANVSYGRFSDDSEQFGYFGKPTPLADNGDHKEFICTPPEFSIKGGFFTSAQQIILAPYEQGSKVYYTLDGSMPTLESTLYTSPIIVDETTVVRAVTFNDFGIRSKDATYTFFFDHQGSLPVFSLSSDPDLLFSKEEGLLHIENAWPSKIVPLHFEYWDNNDLEYKTNVEAKLHGRRSRNFPQRSMRFYARKKYDTPDFNYDFFGDRSLNKYEHIILRNGGSDWEETRIRDAFCCVLAQQFENLCALEHKPVVAYINGEYWGLYNLRERQHERYLANKFNISEKSINFMEYELLADHDFVIFGSSKSYHAIFDTLKTLDMTNDKSVDVLSEMVDLDNSVDYTIFNSFLGNYDWPFNNTRFFSSDEMDGKWRWLVYDMDFTVGVWATGTYNNVLARALTPDTSTFSQIMVKLLENENFRFRFINRYADLMNTKLKFENTVAVYDSLINQFDYEVARHKERWPESLLDYDFRKKKTRDFLRDKAEAERGYIEAQFDLSGHYKLTLTTDITNAAIFEVNSIRTDVLPWSGYYFSGVPIKITVKPNHGKKFIRWSDPAYGDSEEIVIDADKNLELIALFEESTSDAKTIVINEFMYNAPDEADTKDWIELLNYGEEAVDMSLWVISDDNDEHVFTIPDGTSLASGELLVICRNSENFAEIHEIDNYIGDIDFGFGSSDAIRLFDSENELIDIVEYTSEFPWYPEANGTGLSLELIDPEYDNSLPSSWKLTNVDNGTPGKKNSVGDTNTIPDDKDYIFYPNPADDYVRLEMRDPDEFTNIILADTKGRIMADYMDFVGNITKLRNGFHIQVSEFANGVYYLMLIEGETKKDVIPIIIER